MAGYEKIGYNRDGLQLRFTSRDDPNLRLIPWTICHYFNRVPNQDDLVYPGFQGYLKARETFKPSLGKFSTYAIACIRSYILNWFRSERRHTIHDNEDVENLWVPSDEISISDSLTVQELLKKAPLTALEDKVIRLHFFDDLIMHEVGLALDVSDERARQVLLSATIKLRDTVRRNPILNSSIKVSRVRFSKNRL